MLTLQFFFFFFTSTNKNISQVLQKAANQKLFHLEDTQIKDVADKKKK